MAPRRGDFNEIAEYGASEVHYTPWRDYGEMRCQMNELFNRALGYAPLSRVFTCDTQALDPDVDIYEIDEKMVIIVALPGFTPDRLEVESSDNTVFIQGERKPFFEDERAVAYRLGWSTGVNRVHASICIPFAVDPNQATATIVDGVLKLELRKSDQPVSQFVRVPVRGA